MMWKNENPENKELTVWDILGALLILILIAGQVAASWFGASLIAENWWGVYGSFGVFLKCLLFLLIFCIWSSVMIY